jgi:hypothetical protein
MLLSISYLLNCFFVFLLQHYQSVLYRCAGMAGAG